MNALESFYWTALTKQKEYFFLQTFIKWQGCNLTGATTAAGDGVTLIKLTYGLLCSGKAAQQRGGPTSRNPFIIILDSRLLLQDVLSAAW